MVMAGTIRASDLVSGRGDFQCVLPLSESRRPRRSTTVTYSPVTAAEDRGHPLWREVRLEVVRGLAAAQGGPATWGLGSRMTWDRGHAAKAGE